MRRTTLLLSGLILVLSGCGGRPGLPPSPAPVSQPPAVPVRDREPAPPPTTRQEPVQTPLIQSFTINGKLVEDRTVEVPPEPTEVVLRFTAPMAKPGVEYRLRGNLPEGATFEWTAPDRIVIQVPAGRSFSLYAGGALTADGAAVDDGQRSLHVSRVVSTRFRLFDPAVLLAGGAPQMEGSLPMPDGATFALSPDRRQVVIFTADLFVHPAPPYLVDLATGRRTAISGAPEDPAFCWAGWGPDGALLLLDGDGLWRMESGALVRWTTLPERGCWIIERSPDGRYLASWAPLKLTMTNLKTGSTLAVAGGFAPMAQDGGVRPIWSPAGDQIAIGNATQSGIWGAPIETVILDLTGKVVRRIPDWWPLEWLPDGDLLVSRPVADGKTEAARLTREGQPSPRAVPPQGTFSPDGRWVISYAEGMDAAYRLVEVATGRSIPLPNIVGPRWLSDSTLLLVDR